MSRTRFEAYRLTGSVTGGAGSQFVGAVPLAKLASGMSNGTQFYVKAIVAMFDDAGAVANAAPYAQMLDVIIPILLAAGPTYTLGTISTSSRNLNLPGGAAGVQSGVTFTQSGGNLQMFVTPVGDALNVYASVRTIAP